MAAILAFLAGGCGAAPSSDVPIANAAAHSGQSQASSAAAIHARILTLDAHVDIGFREETYATAKLDPGGFTTLQVDLPKMRAGGLDAAYFNVFVEQGPLDATGYAKAREEAEKDYSGINRMLRAYPNQIALARTADDIERIHKSGRSVALLAMENAYPLGPDLGNVAFWAERGVTSILLVHSGHNQFGGSATPDTSNGDSPEDPGLTELGRKLIAELNDHGIIVDVSHAGRRTTLETISVSRAPIIASHSAAKEIYDHPRNLDDEVLLAIRNNGGVAHLAAVRGYIGEYKPEFLEARRALVEELNLDTSEGRQAATQATIDEYYRRRDELLLEIGDITVSDYVDHIDHAVQVAGIDHVGIGSDFDGGGGVGGWNDASETQAVTEELVRRGYSEADIAKIWSGNLLRVMRTVQAARRE
jgi:membrane dipeptidase